MNKLIVVAWALIIVSCSTTYITIGNGKTGKRTEVETEIHHKPSVNVKG